MLEKLIELIGILPDDTIIIEKDNIFVVQDSLSREMICYKHLPLENIVMQCKAYLN
jgi:hypothetical protein